LSAAQVQEPGEDGRGIVTRHKAQTRFSASRHVPESHSGHKAACSAGHHIRGICLTLTNDIRISPSSLLTFRGPLFFPLIGIEQPQYGLADIVDEKALHIDKYLA